MLSCAQSALYAVQSYRDTIPNPWGGPWGTPPQAVIALYQLGCSVGRHLLARLACRPQDPCSCAVVDACCSEPSGRMECLATVRPTAPAVLWTSTAGSILPSTAAVHRSLRSLAAPLSMVNLAWDTAGPLLVDTCRINLHKNMPPRAAARLSQTRLEILRVQCTLED